MAKARWMTAMAGVMGLCTLAVWQPGHAEDMVLTRSSRSSRKERP